MRESMEVIEAPQAESRFLYVIGAGLDDSPVKIGITRHVGDRLRTMQIGNHLKLSAIHVVELERRIAIAAEKACHRALKDSRVSGEWFDINGRDAVRAVSEVLWTNARELEFVSRMLGDELACMRKRAGLTRAELGALMGLTESAFGKLESGAMPISIGMQAKIEAAFAEHEATSRRIERLNALNARALGTDVPMTAIGLREARRRAGLTQAKLAERLGVPQSSIGRLENGGRGISPGMAVRLRKILGEVA